ncbi:hypothetical protein PoB_006002800 [Plakobranchus ocellatus]|uniref:Uncharacterized protein n=1 Tax=Plakobranchus ocellatus TaxID=259542 RepID=A0AAV4CNQ8_9GAST|nr:hypothetical protein PoB_006002800 [Plakobranchus ocellatus]
MIMIKGGHSHECDLFENAQPRHQEWPEPACRCMRTTASTVHAMGVRRYKVLIHPTFYVRVVTSSKKGTDTDGVLVFRSNSEDTANKISEIFDTRHRQGRTEGQWESGVDKKRNTSHKIEPQKVLLYLFVPKSASLKVISGILAFVGTGTGVGLEHQKRAPLQISRRVL